MYVVGNQHFFLRWASASVLSYDNQTQRFFTRLHYVALKTVRDQ